MIALQALKAWALPLLAVVFINAAAAVLRTLPDAVNANDAAETWPEFQLPMQGLDIKQQLLAGGHWGQPEYVNQVDEQATEQNSALKEAGVVREYVQRQLQGIVFRNGWHLLFAQDDGLPLELTEGDNLPESPWTIGRIFPDRIELLDDNATETPLMIFLYPIPDASTEL